jgi:hypothetical protein
MADEELKRLLKVNSAETGRLFEASNERIENRFTVLETRFDKTAADMRGHFDVTTEGTRQELRLVAKALAQLESSTHEHRRRTSCAASADPRTTACAMLPITLIGDVPDADCERCLQRFLSSSDVAE